MIKQILYIVSIAVLTVLSPLGIVYTAIKNAILFRYKTWLKTLFNYFMVIVIAFDQICNVLYQDLFNDIAIQKKGYSFGEPDDTIGYTIRRNFKKDKLTLFGKFIQLIIDHKKK